MAPGALQHAVDYAVSSATNHRMTHKTGRRISELEDELPWAPSESRHTSPLSKSGTSRLTAFGREHALGRGIAKDQ